MYKSAAKGWGYDISAGVGFEVSSGSAEQLYQGRYSEFEAAAGIVAVNGSRSKDTRVMGVDGRERGLKSLGGGLEIPLPGIYGAGGVHSAMWGNSEILGQITSYSKSDGCSCKKD